MDMGEYEDRITEPNQNSWKPFKCRKLSPLPLSGNVGLRKPQTLSPDNPPPNPCSHSPPTQRISARLEICLLDSFCVIPKGLLIQASALIADICRNIDSAAKSVEKADYTVILRGDSTLRGHFPEVGSKPLAEMIKNHFVDIFSVLYCVTVQ